ncbi:glycosyltransferase family 4 protein [Leucobacter sp. wl10]|uniref:glycosyltransferase family 4 protein n=1 Tax=Leucobacter sp. wl10 TaxID=2304677 RepID=UPI000E5A7D6C|nr:glycosyltransferase family 4 protein [Leucobacter sp. wl10]RGE19780.1 glycosyltransferase WbuB [Leucobacter sp. wl10]
MKVLIVSQYFPPENVPIPSDVAADLRARGHSVRVITGFPSYPLGRVFPGYRQRWRQRSMEDCVEVCRVPLYVDHSQSTVKRMLNYITFALSSASARRFVRGADAIYVYATQMTPALGPWLWRMTGGAPYVLHVQDLWPDSITGSSLSGGGRKARLMELVLNPWIGRVYRRAAAVIGIAPTMVETLVERGVSAERAELVFNWARNLSADPETVPKSSKTPNGRVVYAGNVGDMQDLETAIRAAAASAESGVTLSIIGEGVAKARLQHLASELGATNIDFRAAVPPTQMASVYAEADFALVTLKDLPAFRGTVPSKFQAALAHGLPVVTTVQGDVRRLAEERGVGFTADAESIDDLARAFREAARCTGAERAEMAVRSKETAQRLFSRDEAIARIEEILRRAAEERKIGK